MPIPNRPFDKLPLNYAQQAQRLIGRGLSADPQRLAQYLKFVGYYRLSGYVRPFLVSHSASEHRFKPGVTFDDVLNSYIFDRKLRLLVLDVIERVEVAVRAVISDQISDSLGAHWYIKPEAFSTGFDHDKFIENVKNQICHENNKARRSFIKHYYEKYSSPELPPCWMVFEELSFGTVSFVYASLQLEHQKKIASIFGLNRKILKSWLHSIAHLRNLSAHHSRLWNHVFTITPQIPKTLKEYVPRNDKFYAQAVVMRGFLTTISENSNWSGRLSELFDQSPDIDIIRMGFPEGWKTLPPWGRP
jgi:abortive infection bacteriophage resistance protein